MKFQQMMKEMMKEIFEENEDSELMHDRSAPLRKILRDVFAKRLMTISVDAPVAGTNKTTTVKVSGVSMDNRAQVFIHPWNIEDRQILNAVGASVAAACEEMTKKLDAAYKEHSDLSAALDFGKYSEEKYKKLEQEIKNFGKKRK